jgi:hypothetical protein
VWRTEQTHHRARQLIWPPVRGLSGCGAARAQVFREVEPLVTSVMDGYEAAILAYGQTGSGKVHILKN